MRAAALLLVAMLALARADFNSATWADQTYQLLGGGEAGQKGYVRVMQSGRGSRKKLFLRMVDELRNASMGVKSPNLKRALAAYDKEIIALRHEVPVRRNRSKRNAGDDFSPFRGWRRNYKGVLQRLHYWREPVIRQPLTDRYVTFTPDCGGFNNIRMGIEFAVIVAFVTRRTLVLPPLKPWYLIDFGPFARMKPNETEVGRVSGVHTFFNITSMRAAIPVIEAKRFVTREDARLGSPGSQVYTSPERWKSWLASLKRKGLGDELPWSPLDAYIAVPSVKAVQAEIGKGVRRQDVDNRKGFEYTRELHEKMVLHLPSCEKRPGASDNGFRYLGQMATSVISASSDPENVALSVRQVLRDHVRFRDEVWTIAAHVVAWLGGFRYSSLHVRRNELQYKSSWVSPNQTFDNVAPLLEDGETLYIATDETKDSFFDTFLRKHPKVYVWKDFFGPKGGNILTHLHIPRKLIGCIEQAICAMGRVFIGTQYSTFSGYIVRLRGFLRAPDTLTYYHNTAWSDDEEENLGRQPQMHGQEYLAENPIMHKSTRSRDYNEVAA